MTTHSDFLVGRIALERGLLSMDQLAECINDQRQTPAAPLGNIMVRKGLVRPTDLDALLEEQKSRLADALELSDPKLEDALLGRLLVKQGLVKEAQVYDCLRVVAELGERGEKTPRLGELLVRRGHLTTDAVDRALFLPRRETLICPSCRAHFSTAGTDAAKKYTCKQCGCILERQERDPSRHETTESIRIDLPADAAAVAKDPAHRFAGGKYLLVQEVGRGGMGVVWKAWQSDLRRYVAVKILAGTMWTDVELKRFYREAQMAASLSHPNIASIYEVGAHDGKHFIVMEFVDGDSLARLLAPSPPGKGNTARAVKHLPPRRAIEILREAALAVDYAHSKNIIHRDLKPHNIMVQRADGRVYVMDFGLAKPIRQMESITISDAIVGTPQYMSPEQARGDPVDRRTDVFSLGSVLYHVLAGRPPFEGHSPAETMMSVLADDPPSLRRLNPRIHADVDTICVKALDKDRDRRYESARTLADDLGRYLDGEPISARPLSRRERFWKDVRKKPAQWSLVAAAGVAMLFVAGIFLVQDVLTASRVNHLFEQADGAFRRGRLEDAKGYLDRALGLDPNDADARERHDQVVAAIQKKADDAQAALQKRRDDIDEWNRLADQLAKLGNYDEALRTVERVVTHRPDDATAQRRAKEYRAEVDKRKLFVQGLKGKLDEVEAELKQQEQEERRRRERRIEAFSDYEQAREAVEAAANIKPDPGTGFTISDVTEEFERASDALTRALGKDDTYAEARYFRAQVRHRLGKFDFAEQDFKDVWEKSSKSGPAAFGAAMSQLALYMLHAYAPNVANRRAQKGALDRMLLWAQQTKESFPPAFERWSSKALEDFHLARYDDALASLEPVAAEGRTKYFFHFLKACCHLEKKDTRSALQELKTALDLEPVALESLYLSAVVKAKTADLTGAKVDAERAVEAGPAGNDNTYLTHLLFADILHQLGDSAQALRQLDLAASHAGPLAGEVMQLRERWEREARPEK